MFKRCSERLITALRARYNRPNSVYREYQPTIEYLLNQGIFLGGACLKATCLVYLVQRYLEPYTAYIGKIFVMTPSIVGLVHCS